MQPVCAPHLADDPIQTPWKIGTLFPESAACCGRGHELSYLPQAWRSSVQTLALCTRQ